MMAATKLYLVKWTETAEDDLKAIVEYIALDNPDAAQAVFDNIRIKAEKLISFPERGRIVPELSKYGLSQYRELLPTPWRIIYRIVEEIVFVMGIFDGRRDLEDILLERVTRI